MGRVTAMTQLGAAKILLVGALWGGSFLFIRVAAPQFGPLGLMLVRTALAGLVLLGVVRSTGATPHLGDARRFLLLGLVSAAAPFALIAFAELHLPASVAAILNATTPLFTALLAAASARTLPSAQRLLGLLVGVGGVVIVVGIGPVAVTPIVLISVGASLLAAICYAVGGVYAQRRMQDLAPMTVATGQNLGAAAVLLLPALLIHPEYAPSTAGWVNAIALGLLSSAIGYAIFYQLLAEVGATGALSVTFLVPVFGTLWAALFLGEPITGSLITGLFVILAGLFLLLGPPIRRPLTRAHRSTTSTHAEHRQL